MFKSYGRYSLVTALLAFGAVTARADLITNGGFEAGLTGWTVVNTGSGNWFVQTGTGSPSNNFPVPAPPEGINAAMTDQGGGGSHALLQTFTVPDNGSTVILTFDWFVHNQAAGGYSTPNSLDNGVVPNQQARVDILTAGAGAFDLGSSVVDNVFQTNVGDPTLSGYNTLTADLSGILLPGNTYQIRFAEVDNQLFFGFGVDAVSLEATPEPGSLVLGGMGLIGIGLFRFRRTRKAQSQN